MINSRNIELLHPCLQRGVKELIRRTQEKKINILITSTYRDFEYQEYLYSIGRVIDIHKPKVTNAKGGQSIHNYRLAFDIAKNEKGKEYSDLNFFKIVGAMWEDMGGEWGGNWKQFKDNPHFQYLHGLTQKQIFEGKEVPEDAKMRWELKIIQYKEFKLNDIILKADFYTLSNEDGDINFIRLQHCIDYNIRINKDIEIIYINDIAFIKVRDLEKCMYNVNFYNNMVNINDAS